MSNTCKAVVLSCMDFRYVQLLHRYLADSLGLRGNYDHIAFPGGARAIDIALPAIAAARRLHNIEEVHIFDHADCRAYGPDNSEAAHRAGLERARAILNIHYPALPVHLYMLTEREVKKISPVAVAV